MGGNVQLLPALPNGTVTTCVQADATGNIYAAGYTGAGTAFVAKLSPDGSQVIYDTVIVGSTYPSAIALGSDRSVYVTGRTFGGLPAAPGSIQPPSGDFQAFAAKVDSNGSVRYAAYINGAAQGNGITVDSSGHAYITGGAFRSGFAATPGAVFSDNGADGRFTGFIVELDPTGSTALLSIVGLGGSQIALDAKGDIYAAGGLIGPAPTTAGAFQTSAGNSGCFESMLTNLPCRYQHVVKINPTGTQLIYGTYIAGTYGAVPSSMAVDPDGSVILAGGTNSPDYPTTPSAYQPTYLFYPNPSIFLKNFDPPAASGYVTKLNASGTALVWSTFFSGSGLPPTLNTPAGGDTITGMALDPQGDILIAGVARSSDLPGLWTTPIAARPTAAHPLGFIARLRSDGVWLSPTQLLEGQVNSLAVRPDGSAVVAPPLAAVSLSYPGRVGSITDPDNTRVVRVAPGELLALYGIDLSPAQKFQPAGAYPAAFNGVTVTFNGIAGPILYAAGEQVNLQVPYEVAGQNEVTMHVSSGLVSPPISESYILGVIDRQPSLIISPANFNGPLFGVATCGGTSVFGLQPLAFNADGTINSCANPAPPESTVTIFMNGLGQTNPAQETGAIAALQSPLNPAAASGTTTANVVSTASSPGSIDGLTQVQVQVTSTASYLLVPLTAVETPGSSFRVRGPSAVIWTAPAN